MCRQPPCYCSCASVPTECCSMYASRTFDHNRIMQLVFLFVIKLVFSCSTTYTTRCCRGSKIIGSIISNTVATMIIRDV
jgi:hypothetical protein